MSDTQSQAVTRRQPLPLGIPFGLVRLLGKREIIGKNGKTYIGITYAKSGTRFKTMLTPQIAEPFEKFFTVDGTFPDGSTRFKSMIVYVTWNGKGNAPTVSIPNYVNNRGL